MIPNDLSINWLVATPGSCVIASALPLLACWAGVQLLLLLIPRGANRVRYFVMLTGLAAMSAILPICLCVFHKQTAQYPSQTSVESLGRVFSSTDAIGLPSPSNQAASNLHDVDLDSSSIVYVGKSETAVVNQPVLREVLRTALGANPESLRASPLATWLGYLWFLGSLVVSLRIVIAILSVSRIKRSGVEAESSVLTSFAAAKKRVEIHRAVRILSSARVHVPIVVGILRPIIVVPIGLCSGFSPVEIESLLAHELAHVRRWDAWVNLWQLLTETLMFYHPCVWLLNRQIRHQRELCCDLLAARSPSERLVLGQALVKLDQRIPTPNAVGFSSRGGHLLDRIEALCGVTRHRASVKLLSGFALLLPILCVLLALFIKSPFETLGASLEPNSRDVSAEAKDSSTKVIRGKVTNVFDKELPGVLVSIEQKSTCVTDDKGQFQLSLTQDELNELLGNEEPRRVKRNIYIKFRPANPESDFVPQRVEVTARELRSNDDVNLAVTLKRGSYVSGRVVDLDGKALANCLVTDGPDLFSDENKPKVTTDENGRFKILLGVGDHSVFFLSDEPGLNLPSRKELKLPHSRVYWRIWFHKIISIKNYQPIELGKIVVGPIQPIQISVRLPSGEAAKGSIVKLLEPKHHKLVNGDPTWVTDDLGNVLLRPVHGINEDAVIEAQLIIGNKGYLGRIAWRKIKDNTAFVSLSEHQILDGRVTREGRPVGNSLVKIRRDDDDFGGDQSAREVRSDANGDFQCVVERGFDYSVSSENADAVFGRNQVDANSNGEKVGGRVIDDQERPIHDATVLFQNGEDLHEARTDSNGTFNIECNKPVKEYLSCLWVAAPGFDLKTVNPEKSPTGRDNCLIKLSPETLITVEVQNADLSANTTAKVRGHRMRVPNGRYESLAEPGLVFETPTKIAELRESTLDASGKHILRGFSHGSLASLAVIDNENQIQIHKTKRGDVGAHIELMQQAVGNIRVRCVGIDREALGRFRMDVNTNAFKSSAPNSSIECKFDNNCECLIENLAVGIIGVVVNCDTNSKLQPMTTNLTELQLEPGQTEEIVIDFRPAVQVRGQLVRADTRSPMEGVRGSLNTDIYSDAMSRPHVEPSKRPLLFIKRAIQSDDNGNFTLNCAPGKFSLQWNDLNKPKNGNELRYPAGQIVVEVDEVAGLDFGVIEVPLATSFDVVVLDEKYMPIPDRKVVCINFQGNIIAQGRTRSDGIASAARPHANTPYPIGQEDWLIYPAGVDSVEDIRKLQRLKVISNNPFRLMLDK